MMNNRVATLVVIPVFVVSFYKFLREGNFPDKVNEISHTLVVWLEDIPPLWCQSFYLQISVFNDIPMIVRSVERKGFGKISRKWNFLSYNPHTPMMNHQNSNVCPSVLWPSSVPGKFILNVASRQLIIGMYLTLDKSWSGD